MNWTVEMDETLKANRGLHSSAAIGAMLGVTRNAVVGRALRLKLERIAPQGNRHPRLRSGRPRLQNTQPIPDIPRIDDTQIPFDQRKTLRELTDQTCRWPVGDPCSPEFFFCGAKPLETYPYCAGHCAVAFESKSQRIERHATAPRAA